jgi:hypothetical protein
MGKKVAVIIRDRDRQYEGLRSSLGLLLEDHIVEMYVLNHPIEMTEEYLDNMGFIKELEGGLYSNVPENVEKHGFERIEMEELPRRLRECDLIIPF